MIQDEAFVIWGHSGYNLNRSGFRNKNYVYGGDITINKLMTKHILVDVDYIKIICRRI